MSHFQFSLHRLLELRQLELRELELRAAAESQSAMVARDLQRQLLEQLAVEPEQFQARIKSDVLHDGARPQDFAPDKWLMFQQATEAVRQHADAANALAQHHETLHRNLLTDCAAKRVETEALDTLREAELEAFHQRQRRREDSALQEQVLRNWVAQDTSPAQRASQMARLANDTTNDSAASESATGERLNDG